MPESTAADAGRRSWTREETRWALGIAGGAFLLRAALAAMTPVVGADAAAYLVFARDLGAGLWTPSVDAAIHPGYPAAIALAGALLGGVEAGGYAVSVVFSSLAVGLFHVWARDAAGPRVARLSAILFACLPHFVLEHADVMTEGFFHFLFVAAVASAWFGVARRRPAWLITAAVSGALAYATKPEGIYAPVALLGLAVFAIAAEVRARRPFPWGLAGSAAASIALFALLALPLLLWVRNSTGRWALTNKGSAGLATRSVAPLEEPAAAREGFRPRSPGSVAADYLGQMSRATMYLLPLGLAGLAFLRGRMEGLAALYLGALIAGYSFAPIAARAQGYPLSHRYILPAALFALPFISLGCVGLAERAAARWGARRTAAAGAALLAVFVAACALRAVHPRRTEEIPVKQAALWLRGRLPAGAVLRANTYQVQHYLERRVVRLWGSGPAVERHAPAASDYVFVIERDLRKDAPAVWDALEARFRRIARFPEIGGEDLDAVSIFNGPKRP